MPSSTTPTRHTGIALALGTLLGCGALADGPHATPTQQSSSSADSVVVDGDFPLVADYNWLKQELRCYRHRDDKLLLSLALGSGPARATLRLTADVPDAVRRFYENPRVAPPNTANAARRRPPTLDLDSMQLICGEDSGWTLDLNKLAKEAMADDGPQAFGDGADLPTRFCWHLLRPAMRLESVKTEDELDAACKDGTRVAITPDPYAAKRYGIYVSQAPPSDACSQRVGSFYLPDLREDAPPRTAISEVLLCLAGGDENTCQPLPARTISNVSSALPATLVADACQAAKGFRDVRLAMTGDPR